jgi:hypothetical protein
MVAGVNGPDPVSFDAAQLMDVKDVINIKAKSLLIVAGLRFRFDFLEVTLEPTGSAVWI